MNKARSLAVKNANANIPISDDTIAKMKGITGRPRVWTDDKLEEERLALLEWVKNDKNYYLNGFLTERGFSRREAIAMSNFSQSFRNTYDLVRDICEQRLVNLAVTKQGDGNFIKFVLANKHEWKEKTEISGDSANPLALMLDKLGSNHSNPIQAEVIQDNQIE